MNKDVLNRTNVYMGIDTLQVRSDTQSLLMPKQAPYINKTICLSADTGTYSYRLNPDKANDNLQIYNYKDYKEVCSLMVTELGLTNLIKTRIDFRVDSFDNNYNQLEKLNKLIILLLSQSYKMDNRYQSDDPLTFDRLCIRSQNHRLEVENYNKAIQEPAGNVQNRIEFRSKNLSSKKVEKEREEFLKWCKRLDKAITQNNYLKLQELANYYLVKKYKEEQHENVTVNEFLYKYSGNVWTSKQLVDFFEQIGSKNPVNQAKAYKKRKRIEYFSYRDLLTYIDKIKQAGEQFFNYE